MSGSPRFGGSSGPLYSTVNGFLDRVASGDITAVQKLDQLRKTDQDRVQWTAVWNQYVVVEPLSIAEHDLVVQLDPTKASILPPAHTGDTIHAQPGVPAPTPAQIIAGLKPENILLASIGSGTTAPAVSGSTSTPTNVPQGAYLKQRFSNTTWSGNPVTGPQGQPASETVTVVNFQTAESNVSYRWSGFVPFEAGSYDFNLVTTNGIRLTVAGDKIVDEVVLAAQRGIITRKIMPAGNTLVVVDWFNPSGAGIVQLNIVKVPGKTWKSCDDGQTHEGDPPAGWKLTPDGCFTAPIDTNVANKDIDLAKIVKVTPGPDTRIERAYVLGSGKGQDPYRLQFFNCSTNMEVHVELVGPDAVKFVTATQPVGSVAVGGLPADRFTLLPRTQVLVDVKFDTNKFESLPEGLNLSNVFVHLTPGTITIPTGGDGQIQLGLCEGITVPGSPTSSLPVVNIEPLAPTATWRDCSSGTSVMRFGVPPTGWTLRSDGCYVPPPVIQPVVSVDFSATTGVNSLTSLLTGQLAALIGGDDATTYSYAWNFDVLRQGAGSGNATIRTPSVSWILTTADRSALLNGQTTRTVEVVAMKGATVVRIRKQITFRGTVNTSGGTLNITPRLLF